MSYLFDHLSVIHTNESHWDFRELLLITMWQIIVQLLEAARDCPMVNLTASHRPALQTRSLELIMDYSKRIEFLVKIETDCQSIRYRVSRCLSIDVIPYFSSCVTMGWMKKSKLIEIQTKRSFHPIGRPYIFPIKGGHESNSLIELSTHSQGRIPLAIKCSMLVSAMN